MQVTIRAMESSDIPEVVRGWNLSLTHNKIDEARFESVILTDPNHEKAASLVAIHDGKIIGFIDSIVRDGISGADGKGRKYEKDNGYIRGMFVLEEYSRQGIGAKLLDRAEKYIKSKGKSIIKTGTYTGRYFFPGVDLRYEAALKFLADNGFHQSHVINDVDLDLKGFQITDYQRDARRRMADFGVHIEEYDPSMLSAMQEFVRKVNMTAWFPEGWEEGFKKKGNKFAALKDGEIVGWASYHPRTVASGIYFYTMKKKMVSWASYHPRTGSARFGPIAVLEEMRGNGIGSCLMLECVLRIIDAGADRVVASWANTPFYLANDWKICCQYSVLEKSIT